MMIGLIHNETPPLLGNLKERCGNLSGRFPSRSGSGSGGRGRLISQCLDGVRPTALSPRLQTLPASHGGARSGFTNTQRTRNIKGSLGGQSKSRSSKPRETLMVKP